MYLQTCKTLCTEHGFQNNKNMARWPCAPEKKTDGVHPNRQGSQVLAANWQQAVQSAPRD